MPLKQVFLLGAEHPIQIPDKAPEQTCATWSLAESKNPFPDFFWMTLVLNPYSSNSEGGVYPDTVSSSWGILKLVSTGSGKSYKKRDFCIWPDSYMLLHLLLAISKAGWEGPDGPFNLTDWIFSHVYEVLSWCTQPEILEDIARWEVHLEPYYLRLKRD